MTSLAGISWVINFTADSAFTNLEACIADIKHWMLVNFLKLNDDKTEIMLFGSPYFINVMPKISVNVGDI